MLDATTNASRGAVLWSSTTNRQGKRAGGEVHQGRRPDRSRYACKVSDVNRGSDDVCRLWLERRCPHGDSCKFSHPAGRGGPLVASQASVKKCLEFRKRGRCSRGDAAPFAHVAKEQSVHLWRTAPTGASRGRRRGSAGRAIGVSTRILRLRRWRLLGRVPGHGGLDAPSRGPCGCSCLRPRLPVAGSYSQCPIPERDVLVLGHATCYVALEAAERPSTAGALHSARRSARAP